MARFMGSVEGARGSASRLGQKTLSGHVRGWDLGVEVDAFDLDGKDAFTVTVTGGSNGGREFTLGTVTRNDEGGVVFLAADNASAHVEVAS